MTEEKQRIHKYLATLGFGSRRQIEKMIEQQRIEVNSELATLGQAVTKNDKIKIDGKVLATDIDPASKKVLLYHKPEGLVSTRHDPQNRPTVFDNLPTVHNGRWISIGRLDLNTAGLLLFTTDGELANRLMHPSYKIDREYAVRVLGDPSDKMLEQLVTGVELEDGMARFEELVASANNKENSANKWYYVCLQEGRNREVRRIWETLPDVSVSRLKRVRYANIFLEKNLRQGQWRMAEQEEINQLYALVGLTPPVVTTNIELGHKAQRKAKHERQAPRIKKPQNRALIKQQTSRQRRRNSSRYNFKKN